MHSLSGTRPPLQLRTLALSMVVGAFAAAPLAASPDDQAGADRYGMQEDTDLYVAAPGVLANDGLADGDEVSVKLSVAPRYGVVDLSADGSFAYTPPADFCGLDFFYYYTNNGTPDRIVLIQVAGVNDAPVAGDDAYAVMQGTALKIGAQRGILANDFDIDDDVLELGLLQAPAHGALNLHSDGSFDYVPHAGFYGMDSFTYFIHDEYGETSEAGVSIEVLPAPRAPSFMGGEEVHVAAVEGEEVVIAGWASAIDAGTHYKLSDLMFLVVENTNAGLFLVAPAIDVHTGDLTFTVGTNAGGVAEITIVLTTPNDDAADGQAMTFVIEIEGDPAMGEEILAADAPSTMADGSPVAGGCVMGGGKGMPWLGGLVLLALAAGVCVRRRVNA